MRTIIRKFDEDICTKANKQQLIKFEATVEADYIKKTDLDRMMELNLREAKERELEALKAKEELLQFEERVSSQFSKLCLDTIEERLEQYQEVHKNFTQFFNMEDLTDWFKRKSDVTELRHFAKQKASKDDINSLHSLIDEVYSRIKQLSIL